MQIISLSYPSMLRLSVSIDSIEIANCIPAFQKSNYHLLTRRARGKPPILELAFVEAFTRSRWRDVRGPAG